MNHAKPRFAASPSIALLLVALASAGLAEAGKFEFDKKARLDPAVKPAEGKALVYFVRPQNFGGAIKVKLYADGEPLGIISRSSFVTAEVDPGKHEFAGVAENAAFLDATVEAGKIYYVQVAIHMGAWKARTHFEVCTAGSEAMEELEGNWDDLRGIVVTEEGWEWFKDDAEDDKEKMAKYREKGEEFETLSPDHGFDEPLKFE